MIERGLKWYEPETKEYAITVVSENLPDNIKDTGDDILNEIISCQICNHGYRIVHQELQFLRQHNLPLPRCCPFCRIWEKIDIWVKNMTLHDRTCNKCGVEFRTHYDESRAPIILCKDCYLHDVI